MLHRFLPLAAPKCVSVSFPSAAVEFARVRESNTAGAGNPTSSFLRALFTPPLHALHATFTRIGPEFNRGEPSWASRPAQ